MQCSKLQKTEKIAKRVAFLSAANNNKVPNPSIVNILYDFVYQCIRNNVTRVTEWKTTPVEYLSDYKTFLE